MTAEIDRELLTPSTKSEQLLHFLRAEQVPGTYRAGVLAALFVAAVSRSPYLLLHGRFFAEEGTIYFQHMKIGGIWFVAHSVGYIYAFCNVATWLAARAPLQQAPLVTAWLSLGVVALLAWIALSLPSELLPNAGTKIAAATLLVVGPLALPEVWLNTTNSQVYFGVLALLLLFVDLRAVGRAQFIGIAVLLGLAGLSGLYAGALAPLFLFRAVRDRGIRQLVTAGVISVCAIAQLIVVQHIHASGDLAQGRGSLRGFGTIMRDVSTWHLGTFLLGDSLANRLHSYSGSFFRILGFGFLAFIVFLTLGLVLANVPRPRVGWLLAAALAIEEVLVLFGSRHTAAGRYIVVPVAILLLIVVHGTTARSNVAAGIAMVFCGVAFVAGCSVFWTSQPSMLRCVSCPQWQQQVHVYQSGATNQLQVWPYNTKLRWAVTLPRRPAVGSALAARKR